MRIVLSGVESNNKGAELMLYAILQELERTIPNAEVYISPNMLKQGLEYIQTSMNLNYYPTPPFIVKFLTRCKITGILNRLGFISAYLNNLMPVNNVDYFIDGSGLLFSDKRISSPLFAKMWDKQLEVYKRCGSKIIFLPQGFGPLNKQCTKNAIVALDRYSDLIFAREKTSFNYLNAIVKNKEKLKLFTDFTSLVDGKISQFYEHLRGRVCIIPNIQMINKGVVSKTDYFNVLSDIIDTCKSCGYDVYMLNHEGVKDENLANEFIDLRGDDIELVTGLNALEVKGLISTAYLVVSSRYHGVASSLNTYVPCLSTSWHHKYAELFEDFGLTNCVLSLEDIEQRQNKIKEYLEIDKNSEIRKLLVTRKKAIVEQNKEMWRLIWSKCCSLNK